MKDAENRKWEQFKIEEIYFEMIESYRKCKENSFRKLTLICCVNMGT